MNVYGPVEKAGSQSRYKHHSVEGMLLFLRLLPGRENQPFPG